MRSLFSIVFKTPDDLGMRGDTLDEIAERMRRSEEIDESSLLEFAKTVQFILDKENQEENLTNRST